MSTFLRNYRADHKWPYEDDSAIIFKGQPIENDYIDVLYKINGSKEFTSVSAKIQRTNKGSQATENDMLSNESLSTMKRAKLCLPGLNCEAQTEKGNLEVFFHKLQLMMNLEAVGFFELSNVNEVLLQNMLVNLPESPKLSTLYISNYQKLYSGSEVTQFIETLPYIRHVVLIDSRVDCILTNVDEIKSLHIENTAKENENCADDAIASVLENANSLTDLKVHTKRALDFMSYIFWTLYRVDWLKLEKLFVQYSSSDSVLEPLMTYEMVARERENALAKIKVTIAVTPITTKDLLSVVMLLNGDIDKELCLPTKIISHLIIIVTYKLNKNELVLLKNLILNKHWKSQRLEIKAKNLVILQHIWSNVGNKICKIGEFSIGLDDALVITGHDHMERVTPDLIFSMAVYTPHVYEIFSSEEKHIRFSLWNWDINIAAQYGEILAKQYMMETLEVHGYRSCEVLRVAINKAKTDPEARSMAKMTKITVDIQPKDKDVALAVLGLKGLQNTILVLSTETEAEEVKQWEIDNTKWNEGIINASSSSSYSVEYSSKTVEPGIKSIGNDADVKEIITEEVGKKAKTAARIASEDVEYGEPEAAEPEDKQLIAENRQNNIFWKTRVGILRSGHVQRRKMRTLPPLTAPVM